MIKCDFSQITFSIIDQDAVKGCIIIKQLMLIPDQTNVVLSISWLLNPKILPVFVISIRLALLHYEFDHHQLIDDLLFYQAKRSHLQSQFVWNDRWHHHTWRINQKHQWIVQYFEPIHAPCCSHRCSSFSSCSLILKIRNISNLVDDSRLSNIGGSTDHKPQTNLLVFMFEFIFQDSQYPSHIVMLLCGDCKTWDAILVIILDDLISLLLITEVIFIKDDHFIFLISFDYCIEFWVSAAVRNASVSYFQKHIDFMSIFLQLTKCFLHMPWEPVYLITQVFYHIHFYYYFYIHLFDSTYLITTMSNIYLQMSNDRQIIDQRFIDTYRQSLIEIILLLNKYKKVFGTSDMHTPKYSHISSRDLSPLRGSSNKHSKTYTSEDIHKIIRNIVEPKLHYYKEQLEERQQVIVLLNEKLNQNDQKLLNQRNFIDSFIKKQKENPQIQTNIVQNINHLLNDKVKQYWENITMKLKQIGNQVLQDFDVKKLERAMEMEIQKLKSSVQESIDSSKKKSNSYWLKIKEALNKINHKIQLNQKQITDLHIRIENFQNMRSKDRECINELQNGKRVVKNLIQLKKSVNNLYQNYQAILNLQKDFRKKIEEPQDDWEVSLNQQQSNVYLQNEDLVALQYSKEDANNDIQFDFAFQKKMDLTTIKNHHGLSPLKGAITDHERSLLGLQKTTPLMSHHPLMNNHHQTTPLMNHQAYSLDQSEILSLNTSNQQLHSRMHINSQNSTLINLSLDARKEMTESIRDRLLELIQIKNMQKPLRVEVDHQINYLKTIEGNYLFDVKGNMFKTTEKDLIILEEEGLILRKKKSSKNVSGLDIAIKRSHC